MVGPIGIYQTISLNKWIQIGVLNIKNKLNKRWGDGKKWKRGEKTREFMM